jgi:hypothetical protein
LYHKNTPHSESIYLQVIFTAPLKVSLIIIITIRYAKCASAANVVCRDVDVFGARNVLLNCFCNML